MSLSALSIDLVIALAQRPDGIGAGELARIVDGPPTSVQNALRRLTIHGLVTRRVSRWTLESSHPAASELVSLGLRLAAPQEALRLVLCASDRVEFACMDGGGFIVGTGTRATPKAAGAFATSLEAIRRGREDVPIVLQFEIDELARIIHSAILLRTRIGSADVLKGGIRWAGPLAPDRYPTRTG